MFKIEINNANHPVDKRSIHKLVKAVIDKFRIKTGEISIAFISNKEIKKINKLYRGYDKPTDVLSFGNIECDANIRMHTNDTDNSYAEIIISYEQAEKQAEENKISISDEIERLLIHGMLHLIGYNHKTEQEAREMEVIENEVIINGTVAERHCVIASD